MQSTTLERARASARAVALAILAISTVAAIAAAGASRAKADEAHFIIVNPGGRGNQSKAGSFLADVAQAIAAAWPDDEAVAPVGWHGHYHVTVPDALASIHGSEPVLGLVTPAFLAAHGEELGLRLVARAERASPRRVHLVGRIDDTTTRSAVEGGDVASLRIGGRLAAEPEWTRRHVLGDFRGTEAATLVAVERDLEAIRQLQRSKLDVALLDAADWERLVELGRSGGLASLARTGELPELAVVAVAHGSAMVAGHERAELGRAAGRALTRFDETEEGRRVLERMTIERFVATNDSSATAGPAEEPSPSKGERDPS